ncbi:sporulation YhaL family protein [Bacillus sp. T3]|uniref:sporulation YhaL family protein n=1 Tax=Bacillus sp. T3 TaxID=467262 RepID=UPI002981276E|nr:sporulation YhaL family protein [Bacillus sp. T3]
MTIPVWVYFVVAGILMSAIMTIKTGRADRKLEQEMIEREGNIYMERLEKEKELRKQDIGSVG